MAFAPINDIAAPVPSAFFAQNLLGAALPTNSPWQNFVLNDGGQPEYIHPYLVQSVNGSLAVCYPERVVQPGWIFQVFVATLVFSWASGGSHTVSSYDDLSVTLELPGPVTVPLVRGSPYITFIVKGGFLTISSNYTVVDVIPNVGRTRTKIVLSNGQQWLVYSSSPLDIGKDLSVSSWFQGTVRVAVIPGADGAGNATEPILDRFSSVFPIAGQVDLTAPYTVRYQWYTEGSGDLLMLSHPVHRQILASPPGNSILTLVSYRSIDGELLGVVGDSWTLQEKPIAITWHSTRGFRASKNGAARERIVQALQADVANLEPIAATGTYFFGKAIARVARLALIAEEIRYPSVTPAVVQYLRNALTPWLNGSFEGNGLGYDQKWGGLVSTVGAQSQGGDFGLGVYNDHYYHFGYFVYACAVLAKFDPAWGRQFRPQVMAIVGDYTAVTRDQRAYYTRLRHFDLWKLHSWASGLTVFSDGRNQESSSEAVNAYYSAALLGAIYGDPVLKALGSTLAALEMRSAKTFWHVPLNSRIYDPVYVKENRVTGVVWANKRDSALWFAPATSRECRTGIQIIPILPITELLFSDLGYAQQLVDWTAPVLSSANVTDAWKGFVYALQATYDQPGALGKVATLKSHDDGNSLTNLLWWVYTRPSA